MIKNAKSNSPFYQEFYKGIPFNLEKIEQIKDLPILKKDIFKEAISNEKIICKNYKTQDLVVSHTTGSTGTPLEILFDKSTVSKRGKVQNRFWNQMKLYPYNKYAKIWRHKELSKYKKSLKKAGLFLPIDLGDVSNPISSAMTSETLKKIVFELKEFEPQVIRGYVSALYTIATQMNEMKIKLNDLDSVVTSAEYLPETMWDFFEKTFQCPVYNLYGGTEAPSIAVNKSNNHNLVISEDLYFIEVLDENGNDVKPGNPGLITITDLYSKATPLIRYQIGDIAIVDDNFFNYDDNFRYFKSVEGRTNDIFELSNGSLIYTHVWHIYFRDEDWVEKFQVVQKERSLIEIKILVKNKGKGGVRFEKFKNKIESAFQNVRFRWELVESISPLKGDKFRAVVSLVDNSFNKLNKA
tara:strand:- start:383 stop:1612 length:1230 start_codon:yes stop_codon:yes gene_type:complete